MILRFAQSPWQGSTTSWVIAPQEGIFGAPKDSVFELGDRDDHASLLWRLFGENMDPDKDPGRDPSTNELMQNANNFLHVGGMEVRVSNYGHSGDISIRYDSTAMSPRQMANRVIDKVLNNVKQLPKRTNVFIDDYGPQTMESKSMSLEEFFNL